MKIAIVAPSSVPFVLGGAERLWLGLLEAINDLTPHDAELIKLPSPERNLAEVIASYDRFTRLDLSHFDLVVSTKYPAWMVDHPNHVLYLQHTLRGLYDTYHLTGLPLTDTSPEPEIRAAVAVLRRPGVSARDIIDALTSAMDALGPDHAAFAFPGPLAREAVQALDSSAFTPGRISRYLAISRTVARREGYFPVGVEVHAIPHPSNLTGFRCGPQDAFFTASRLDGPKRLDLLIAAMRHVPLEVPLVIAGTGPDEDRLRSLASDDPRIRFVGRLSDEELLEGYASALAVPFVPFDEDLGLITIEAMMSSKPVVTVSDAGGPTELVRHGMNGLIAEPTPADLGGALTTLADDRPLAARMGLRARSDAEAITWRSVVDAICPTARRRPHRSKVVVLSTYPAYPARGGGALRLLHLARAVAENDDVEIVALDDAGGRPGHTAIGPGTVQTVVARSRAHLALAARLEAELGVPSGDVAAALGAADDPACCDALRRALEGARCVVLAHPYLYPLLATVSPETPFAYDAHNVEFVLKAGMFRPSEAAVRHLSQVLQVERQAVRRAEVVIACSEEDREILERLGPTLARMVVVPNGADVRSLPFVTGAERVELRQRYMSRFRSANPSSACRYLAAFIGSLHPPNNQAADLIVDVASTLPDVLFVHLGSHGSHLRRRPLPPNVAVRGVVSDGERNAVLSAADVALNPMITGSGTNLKMIEYFAFGVPVIATAVGARGLGALPEEHFVLAEPATLHEAVAAVLRDGEAKYGRVYRARQLAEQRFDWRIVGAEFRSALETVGSGGGAPPSMDRNDEARS